MKHYQCDSVQVISFSHKDSVVFESSLSGLNMLRHFKKKMRERNGEGSVPADSPDSPDDNTATSPLKSPAGNCTPNSQSVGVPVIQPLAQPAPVVNHLVAVTQPQPVPVIQPQPVPVPLSVVYPQPPSLIQPPLPLDPPPEDPIVNEREPEIAIKEERDDPEEELEQPEEEEPHIEPPLSPQQKPEICRDFIRGMCSRQDCRYLHERDISQLEGVYTFCRDFQNPKGCSRPTCRYMHATVFQKENFLRTAYLPPEVIEECTRRNANAENLNKTPIKNNAAGFTPAGVDHKAFVFPPPPPPPPTTQSQMDIPRTNGFTMSLANPPPQMAGLIESLQAPIMSCPPPNLQDEEKIKKRTWKDIEQMEEATCGGEAIAKRSNCHKCGNCVILENRLNCLKNRVDTLKKSVSEYDDKMSNLDKKHQRLLTCLLLVLQTSSESGSGRSQPTAALAQLLQSNLSEPMSSGPKPEQNKAKTLVAEQLKQLLQHSINKKNTDESSLKVNGGNISGGTMNGSIFNIIFNRHTEP